jgi:hypothetical protein
LLPRLSGRFRCTDDFPVAYGEIALTRLAQTDELHGNIP